MIRVMIVDDEEPARIKLRQLISGETDLRIVGESANGPEAVVGVREHQPDMMFLDVQMPDMDGFEVLQQLGDSAPLTVFVTAHDEHAIRAFDVHALDYLLKPVTAERFRRAVERARSGLLAYRPESVSDVVAEQRGTSYLTRLVVHDVGRITLIPVEQIELIESADNYAHVHWSGGRAYVRMTMKQLEQGLDPRIFRRVHRRAIVRLTDIRALEHAGHGRYQIVLASGRRVRTSRDQGVTIRRLLANDGRNGIRD